MILIVNILPKVHGRSLRGLIFCTIKFIVKSYIWLVGQVYVRFCEQIKTLIILKKMSQEQVAFFKTPSNFENLSFPTIFSTYALYISNWILQNQMLIAWFRKLRQMSSKTGVYTAPYAIFRYISDVQYL